MKSDVAKRIESINNGIIPEGYKKTKVGIVPVEWEDKKIKDYLVLSERPIILEDSEEYELVTVRRGFVGVDSRGKQLGESILVKNYYQLKENDFLISKRQIAHGACGIVPLSLSGAVVSNEYNVFTAKRDLDVFFFNKLMQHPYYKRLFYLMSDGVHIEKLLFKTKDWMKRKISIPPLPEQQKIAEILSTQDKLIELQERKINQLKTLKKGYLQKMFPKKGSKYPELRFKGFTDPWEQRELEEVITVGNGMDYKHLSEGDIPVYGTGGYMLSVDKALSYDKDAIGIGRKGTIDKPYVLKAPFWTVDTLFYCIPKENFSLDFVYCVFQNVNWKEKDESTGVPSLSKVNINSTGIKVPALAEQEKIGAYFSNLDTHITLHQRKLDEEKQKKKALMQLLLTGKVRVI